MPRTVFITTAALVVLAGLAGYGLGLRQVTAESGGVIRAVADQHVAKHGGAVTDCVATPGTGAVVFHVRCGDVLYAVDRLGRVREVAEDGI